MSSAPAITVDAAALRNNLAVVRRFAPAARVIAAVKANAYGHGLVLAARALADADAFGVARVEEALSLREAGIAHPIVVLEGVFAALIGSLLASGAVIAGVHFGVDQYLRGRVEFVTTWVGLDDAWIVVPVLILIGIVLAALSASFAIRRWLRA